MWDWFLTYWSSVGLAAAIVLALLLFFTKVCRGRLQGSRWRDPVWVAWLTTLAYLLHNFEEYGVDALGRAFHFPLWMCQQFGHASLEACPIPLSYFVAVNIPLIWIALPIAALWCRSNPAVGLSGAGLLLGNAVAHVGGLLAGGGYSSGTLTAAVIFLPLSIWTFVAFFGQGKLLRWPVLGAILVASLLMHGILLGLMLAFLGGVLSLLALIVLQQLCPLVLLLLPWLASRKWPGLDGKAMPRPWRPGRDSNPRPSL